MTKTHFYCPECEIAGHRHHLRYDGDSFVCECGKSYSKDELREEYEQELNTMQVDMEWLQECMIDGLEEFMRSAA